MNSFNQLYTICRHPCTSFLDVSTQSHFLYDFQQSATQLSGVNFLLSLHCPIYPWINHELEKNWFISFNTHLRLTELTNHKMDHILSILSIEVHNSGAQSSVFDLAMVTKVPYMVCFMNNIIQRLKRRAFFCPHAKNE